MYYYDKEFGGLRPQKDFNEFRNVKAFQKMLSFRASSWLGQWDNGIVIMPMDTGNCASINILPSGEKVLLLDSGIIDELTKKPEVMVREMEYILIHELEHLKQLESGDLVTLFVDDNRAEYYTLVWKGEEFIMPFVKLEMSVDEYDALPWEQAAIDAEIGLAVEDGLVGSLEEGRVLYAMSRHNSFTMALDEEPLYNVG